MQLCGFPTDTVDVDCMKYSINMCSIPHTKHVPFEYNGLVYRIYTNGLHPGYAKLIDEACGSELRHIRAYSRICGDLKHSNYHWSIYLRTQYRGQPTTTDKQPNLAINYVKAQRIISQLKR